MRWICHSAFCYFVDSTLDRLLWKTVKYVCIVSNARCWHLMKAHKERQLHYPWAYSFLFFFFFNNMSIIIMFFSYGITSRAFRGLFWSVRDPCGRSCVTVVCWRWWQLQIRQRGHTNTQCQAQFTSFGAKRLKGKKKKGKKEAAVCLHVDSPQAGQTEVLHVEFLEPHLRNICQKTVSQGK